MILNEGDLSTIVQVEHRNQEVSDIKFSPGMIVRYFIYFRLTFFPRRSIFGRWNA